MATKQTFIPGSNWLYFKVYSGTTTASKILTEIVLPLCKGLLQENTIQQWFFIRYADPDPHLRIRFWCENHSKIGQVIAVLNERLQNYVDQDLVWKLQIDTYQRELERYGEKTINVSEELFYYDSEMIINALDLIEDPQLKFFFVLKSIDQLLEDFGLNTEAKQEFTYKNGNAFKNEFYADKKLKKQLDLKYRAQRIELEKFLNFKEHENYQPLIDLINSKSKKSKSLIKFIFELERNKKLEISVVSLLSSYVHMHVNRFFDARQRLYEMVCYDFLERYYRNVLGKEKFKK